MDFVLTLLFLAVAFGVFALVGRAAYQYRSLEAQVRQSRQQRQEVIDFLNHFSRHLARVTEIDDAMQLVAHYLADVLQAGSVAIFTVEVDPADKREKLRGSAVAGMFPPFHTAPDIVLAKAKYLLEFMRNEHIEFGEGILGRVAADKKSVLIRSAAEYPKQEDLPRRVETLMAVPMHVENRFVGVTCAVNCREEGRCFDEDDLSMLDNLSYQAALASNLVTIYSERSKQERILKELQLGREIQESLLPSKAPEWGDYEFADFSRAALEVGGDYYDFVVVDENRLMIVIADATGKGVPACMLMAMCRSFVRSLVEQYAGLERFLEDLNRRLFRDTDLAHFLTMAVVVIDKETHVCEYGSAGHTPLLLRLPDGRTRCINPEGPALGLLPPDMDVSFDTLSFSFHPGISLFVFTDGFTEALNPEGEEFGMERLEQLWREKELSPQDTASLVLKEVAHFSDDAPQFDDQTMLIIARR